MWVTSRDRLAPLILASYDDLKLTERVWPLRMAVKDRKHADIIYQNRSNKLNKYSKVVLKFSNKNLIDKVDSLKIKWDKLKATATNEAPIKT